MVVVIDNYDSFTYNLVQYIQELGAKTIVFRNDKISLSRLKRMQFKQIVISPGPGRPEQSGISCDVISTYYQRIPILGVCLGHQCIGHIFGGKIKRAPTIMHGKTSQIIHSGKNIFKGIKNPFLATRYHSLIVDSNKLPLNLKVTAWTDDDIIMGMRDSVYPLFGVQFHPESILTGEGKKILANFLKF